MLPALGLSPLPAQAIYQDSLCTPSCLTHWPPRQCHATELMMEVAGVLASLLCWTTTGRVFGVLCKNCYHCLIYVMLPCFMS